MTRYHDQVRSPWNFAGSAGDEAAVVSIDSRAACRAACVQSVSTREVRYDVNPFLSPSEVGSNMSLCRGHWPMRLPCIFGFALLQSLEKRLRRECCSCCELDLRFDLCSCRLCNLLSGGGLAFCSHGRPRVSNPSPESCEILRSRTSDMNSLLLTDVEHRFRGQGEVRG